MSATDRIPGPLPNSKALLRQVQTDVAEALASARSSDAAGNVPATRDPALLGVLYALLLETQTLRKLTVFLLLVTVAVLLEAVFEALLYFHLG